MEEEWCIIDDFPNYEVSSTGLVMNSTTNRILKTSKTSQGAIKVGLMGFDGKQHTRSVKVLVAEAFVGGMDEICNTPINLDCDQTNCNAYNLLWRPRWFSWKYIAQFGHMYRYYTINPVRDITGLTSEYEMHGVEYPNIRDAAITNGLLMKDILVSCHQGTPCFPTRQRFVYAANPQT